MNSLSRIRAGQGGMSLIEMMIAMTISLIVIGAVSGVYLSTSRSYTQDELISRMQENARYALHTLAQEVSMAGYWGPLISGGDINTTPRSCESSSAAVECQGLSAESTLAVDVDCAPGTIGVASNWAITIDPPIEYMNQVTSGSTANSTFSCITASDFLDGTDIMVVKRVEGTELASTRNDGDDDQHIFIRTNGLDAMLFEYDDDLNVSEGADISDWRYRATVYYIRDHFLDADDGIPTLARQSLDRDDMEPEPGGIAHRILPRDVRRTTPTPWRISILPARPLPSSTTSPAPGFTYWLAARRRTRTTPTTRRIRSATYPERSTTTSTGVSSPRP